MDWIPAAVLLGLLLLFPALLLAAWPVKVFAWYLLPIVLPAAGLLTLLSIALMAIVRRLQRRGRRLGRPALGALGVSILALVPALGLVLPLPFPASLRSARPVATVRLPANVPLKVAWGGDRQAVNYHVIAPDQRWAYDFVVAPYFSGSTRLEDYGCYGIPVVAPAAGTVSAAHDGEPDMVPGTISNNREHPSGNYVAIRLDTGTYLLIAHLKPGSVAVTAGQPVAEGQIIGQCGNSGNTSEPHIHIHHQRQDPALTPIGMAEGLPLYFRDLDGPAMPEGGIRMENGKPVATGDTVQHIGH